MALKSEKRYKTWVFTLNNYTQGDLEAIRLTPNINYLICGEERAPRTGTPHLQGYVQFNVVKRLSTIKKLPGYGRSHLQVARGSAQDNYNYCTKSGDDYFELGTLSQVSQQGITQIDTLIDEKMSGSTDRELYDCHRAYYAHNIFKVEKVVTRLEKSDALTQLNDRYVNAELRPWQKIALQLLLLQDNRKILFCYESKGNVGKSFLADYICVKHNGFEWDFEKSADGAYAYNGEPIVVFDLVRSDEIPCKVMEKLKNGKMASPKYESHFKRFRPAKVIVFTNYKPQVAAQLSQDRLEFLDIDPFHIT
jgi:hypothetical protein